MTNCVNCGAVLNGVKCEYCGTDYSNGKVHADFSQHDCVGKMKLGDKEIDVYIGHMEGNVVGRNAYRDEIGNLHIEEPRILRKFTVIEI